MGSGTGVQFVSLEVAVPSDTKPEHGLVYRMWAANVPPFGLARNVGVPLSENTRAVARLVPVLLAAPLALSLKLPKPSICPVAARPQVTLAPLTTTFPMLVAKFAPAESLNANMSMPCGVCVMGTL